MPGLCLWILDIGIWPRYPGYLLSAVEGGQGILLDVEEGGRGWGRNLVIHFTDTFVSVHTLPLEEDRFFQARVKASSRNPCK